MSPFASRTLTVLALVAMVACGTPGPQLEDVLPADALLLGEQHDDPTHQRHHRDVVQTLAVRGQLSAVAIEMAEEGNSTAGLPRGADESAARAALRWNEQAWPWQAYSPAVMAAVGAGVPVLGANLPRGQMRSAMADTALDGQLDPGALAAQREAIRTGHCDLLPAQQIDPMTRIQIARDIAMARTVANAAVPGKTVLLLAGAGHVDPVLGVPRHLPDMLKVRVVVLQRSTSMPAARTDYCAQLRRQLQPAG